MNPEVALTPLPQRRPWGLLVDSAGEIPTMVTRVIPDPVTGEPVNEVVTDGVNRSRIAAGITFVPMGCDGLEIAPTLLCSDDEFEAPDDIEVGDCPVFESFTILTSESASSLDYDIETLRTRHDARVATYISKALAQGLMTAGSTNLSTEATVLTEADGLTPLLALQSIEEHLANVLHGAVGHIHVTPAGLVTFSDHLQFIDGRWYTPSGHTVIADAGYEDQPPTGETAPAGVGWIYGSSPVEWLIGDPTVDSFGTAEQYLDRTRNVMSGWSERPAVTIFDPCSVGAARYVYDYEFYGS